MPETVADRAEVAARKGFLARAIGMFTAPGEAFEDIARRPTVLAPLLVVLATAGIFGYAAAPSASRGMAEVMGRSKLFQRMPEERREEVLAQMRETTALGQLRGGVGAVVTGGIAISFLGLLLWGAGHLLGGEPTYKGEVSVLSFASLVSHAAGNAVRLPLMIAKDTVFGVTLSPAIALPNADWHSTSYLATAIYLDLFYLWGAVLGTIGLAKVAKISPAAAGGAVAVLYLLRCTALFLWIRFATG